MSVAAGDPPCTIRCKLSIARGGSTLGVPATAVLTILKTTSPLASVTVQRAAGRLQPVPSHRFLRQPPTNRPFTSE